MSGPTSPSGVKATLPLRTVLRFCPWAAVVGLAMGLYLGREILLGG